MAKHAFVKVLSYVTEESPFYIKVAAEMVKPALSAMVDHIEPMLPYFDEPEPDDEGKMPEPHDAQNFLNLTNEVVNSTRKILDRHTSELMLRDPDSKIDEKGNAENGMIIYAHLERNPENTEYLRSLAPGIGEIIDEENKTGKYFLSTVFEDLVIKHRVNDETTTMFKMQFVFVEEPTEEMLSEENMIYSSYSHLTPRLDTTDIIDCAFSDVDESAAYMLLVHKYFDKHSKDMIDVTCNDPNGFFKAAFRKPFKNIFTYYCMIARTSYQYPDGFFGQPLIGRNYNPEFVCELFVEDVKNRLNDNHRGDVDSEPAACMEVIAKVAQIYLDSIYNYLYKQEWSKFAGRMELPRWYCTMSGTDDEDIKEI